MKVLEHLNKAAAYIPLVDSQDLSALPAIINELEQTMLEESIPEAVLIQFVRCCKLAEHITLNETDFENGIRKLSQNIITISLSDNLKFLIFQLYHSLSYSEEYMSKIQSAGSTLQELSVGEKLAGTLAPVELCCLNFHHLTEPLRHPGLFNYHLAGCARLDIFAIDNRIT